LLRLFQFSAKDSLFAFKTQEKGLWGMDKNGRKWTLMDENGQSKKSFAKIYNYRYYFAKIIIT
jgi:hypothetical protein